MRNSLIIATCLIGTTFVSTSFHALEKDASQGIDECSRELIMAYFPEQFVKETLKKFNVPEGEWASIVQELNAKDKDVIGIVEEKASKVDPNPLKDPSQRLQAVKIFRDTLFEIFSGVLKQHGVTDEAQIQQMLTDVNKQKTARFTQCVERQRASNITQPIPQPQPQ